MKKQDYIDRGLEAGLTLSQIESVLIKVLEISKEELFTKTEISSRHIYEVQRIFYEMQSGSPEEYTLGTANFYGRDFFVDDRVLIPRNDTELLVKIALKKLQEAGDTHNMTYIDVGTGSSCIAVSMVLEMYPLKFKKAFALDISPAALEVARKNIEEYASGKIELHESDLLSAVFHDDLRGQDLCITANLPYIKAGDHINMDASVIQHEPDSALYGGSETGFELYQNLIKQCFQMKQVHKLATIHMFIEIGFDQRELSETYLKDLGLSFEYFTDSSNIERVISITGF